MACTTRCVSMKNNHFYTPHNVAIQFPSTAIGRRIVAFIIDYLLVIGMLYLMIMADLLLFEWWVIVLFVAFFLTFPLIQETATGGASIGKLIMSLRVVKIDGSKAHFSDYVMRWILGLFELYTMSGLVAIVSASMSSKTQRLGDMAADTVVVSLASKTKLDDTRITLEETHEIQIPEVDLLSSKQISVIMRTVYRAKKHRSQVSKRRLEEIAEKAATVMGYEVPEDSLEFLEQIVVDYTYLHDET